MRVLPIKPAYAFANLRANRMQVLLQDGFSLWLCTRHLHEGSLHWPSGQEPHISLNDQQWQALTVEIRLLRHLRFGAKTEAMDAAQSKLFEEANAEDLGAAVQQLAQLGIKTPPAAPKDRPARQPLSASLRPAWTSHEPEKTTCGCANSLSRVSQDVSERLVGNAYSSIAVVSL